MFGRFITLYKVSFTGLSRSTWLLSVIMLINRSGTMVVPFMTLYLTGPEMGHTLSEAGTVMALFGLGSVIGAWFGGKFSDRTGFYNVQLFTLFGGGLLFMVLGQLRSYPLICLFTFLLSLVNEAFRPANSSAVAFYSKPENRTRSYSLNRLAVNLGWAIGASAGGLIASVNYELLFWVDGGTNICAAFLLMWFLKPDVAHQSKQKEMPVLTVRSAYKDRGYLWFIFLSTLFAICFFQLFTTVPNYFRDNLHLSESFIGLIMAINGLIIVLLEMILVYMLEKRNRIVFYITTGTIICALSYSSLLLPGNSKVVALLMILLITFGEILAMPFMNTFWTLRSDERNRGQYAALYTMAWGTAQTVGPFVCSRIVDASSFQVLFCAMAIVTLLAAAGFSRLRL